MRRLVSVLVLLAAASTLWGAISSRLNIEETDGSPSTFPYKLKVTAGSLTDNGDGTATLSTGAGGGGGGPTGQINNGSTYQTPFYSVAGSSNVLSATSQIQVFPSSVTILSAIPIVSTGTLQAGATIYVASGTVAGQLSIVGATAGTSGTWTGAHLFSSPSISSFTYGLSVGSITQSGAATNRFTTTGVTATGNVISHTVTGQGTAILVTSSGTALNGIVTGVNAAAFGGTTGTGSGSGVIGGATGAVTNVGGSFSASGGTTNIALRTTGEGEVVFATNTVSIGGVRYRYPTTLGAGGVFSVNTSSVISISAAGAGDAVLAATQTFTGQNTFLNKVTISTAIAGVTRIQWADGTTQVSSPTAGSGGSTTLVSSGVAYGSASNAVTQDTTTLRYNWYTDANTYKYLTISNNVDQGGNPSPAVSLQIDDSGDSSPSMVFTKDRAGEIPSDWNSATTVGHLYYEEGAEDGSVNNVWNFCAYGSASCVNFITNYTTGISQISSTDMFSTTVRIKNSTTADYVVHASTNASLTSNTTYYWPPDGTSGQLLSTNGSGALSWTTASGTGDAVLASTQTFTGQNTFLNKVTISTAIAGVTRIQWADGTVQVSSPVAGGGGSDTKPPITYNLDGAGVVISSAATSLAAFYEVPYSITISSYTLSCDVTTSTITLSVSSTTAANFTSGATPTSICASACPSLASQRRKGDGTLTGWTKTFAAGDYLHFDLATSAPEAAKRCLLQLWL